MKNKHFYSLFLIFFIRTKDKIVIRLGMVDLTDKVFIERKVIDAKFPEKKEIDLALLKLDRKVFFHQSVSPICLPDETNIPSE
jgi:hypothetical protein